MRNAFDEFMNAWFRDEVLFVEGAVTRDKAQIMDTINHTLAVPLVKQAQEAGLKVEAQYVDDIEDALQPAIINVQMGGNETFHQSEYLTIEVYDDNNIKVRLTNAVREYFQLKDGYLAFESLQAATDYLGKLYTGVTRTVAENLSESIRTGDGFEWVEASQVDDANLSRVAGVDAMDSRFSLSQRYWLLRTSDGRPMCVIHLSMVDGIGNRSLPEIQAYDVAKRSMDSAWESVYAKHIERLISELDSQI
jgi:hypothetical protein